MQSAPKVLLAAAIAGICFCIFAPAAATASAPPIGDSCLVGRWVETIQMAHWGWNGQVIAVRGLQGMVVTFSADGTETDDLSQARHLIGDDNGHQLQVVVWGNAQFRDHADGAVLTQSAVADNVGVSYIYDGQPIQGGAPYPPVAYTYRCTATTLHREAGARVSPFAPLTDDLVRSPVPQAGSASLVSPFSSSLATPGSVLAAPVTLLVSAAVALGAVLLITFPSHLFNRTYEENHEVIRYWWERRFRRLMRLRIRTLALSSRSLRDTAAFVLILVCGGILGSLLDPRFGPNLRTVVLFAGALLALLAGSVIGFSAAAGYRIARHNFGPWRLHALPTGLIVAAACVLVSRLTDFQPGYLYGLIGGIAFARELGDREKGHVVAVTSLLTLVIAVGAWLAWTPVSAQSATHPTNAGLALASNFLAALFVSGMVGLVIGLVPLRFLPGEKLASWHRGVWGAVFGLAALSVVEVMLRPQSADVRVTNAPFLTTAALFIGFGVASVAFWAFFRFRNQSRAAPANSGAQTPDG